jgi:membrane-associated protein
MPRSRELLDRYGHGRAIVLARSIPVIRTVLNPVARALAVPVRGFTLWQTIGGLLWRVGLVLAGNLLGRSVPGIDQYLLPVTALIVVVSLIPLVIELVRARRAAVNEDHQRVWLGRTGRQPDVQNLGGRRRGVSDVGHHGSRHRRDP